MPDHESEAHTRPSSPPNLLWRLARAAIIGLLVGALLVVARLIH